MSVGDELLGRQRGKQRSAEEFPRFETWSKVESISQRGGRLGSVWNGMLAHIMQSLENPSFPGRIMEARHVRAGSCELLSSPDHPVCTSSQVRSKSGTNSSLHRTLQFAKHFKIF